MAKKIIYFLIITASIIIPFFLISEETIRNYGVFLSLFYSILFGVGVGNLIYSFDKFKSDKIAMLATFIGFIASIIYFIFYLNIDNNDSEEYFEKNGHFTIGTVVNGFSEKRAMEKQFNSVLKIKYFTKDSQLIYVNYSVGDYQFKEHYKDELVPLIYSTEDHQRIKVLTNEEEINKWMIRK